MPDAAHDEQHGGGASVPPGSFEPLAGLSDAAHDIAPERNRLWQILAAAPVGVCVTNEKGHFEYVNPHYCRLYGYRPEELLGTHFTVVVPEAERQRLSELHEEFISRRGDGEATLRGEWGVISRDGSEQVILADAAYLEDMTGRPKKVTFIVDITERKRIEHELQETISELHAEIHERRRLEATKQEVERMMRHDLRNPLNGMLTAAELLLRGELSEEQRELVLAIRDSGRRLDTMIASSMDYVRMEEGSYQLDPRRLNLLDVFRAVENQLASILSSSKVKLAYRVDGEQVDWNGSLPIFGEVIYLEELFANLVRNAIEASDPGDTVLISLVTQRAGSASQARAETYRVRIHNTHPVPEDVRDRFFERYATSGKRGGNGLGTYIASLIVRAHNGSIRFETDEEYGTDVYVELPQLPVAKEEA
ncbi:MAG: two-component system sensor histidine kinase NtrB [Spirochaetaceae bacterium]